MLDLQARDYIKKTCARPAPYSSTTRSNTLLWLGQSLLHSAPPTPSSDFFFNGIFALFLPRPWSLAFVKVQRVLLWPDSESKTLLRVTPEALHSTSE